MRCKQICYIALHPRAYQLSPEKRSSFLSADLAILQYLEKKPTPGFVSKIPANRQPMFQTMRIDP